MSLLTLYKNSIGGIYGGEGVHINILIERTFVTAEWFFKMLSPWKWKSLEKCPITSFFPTCREAANFWKDKRWSVRRMKQRRWFTTSRPRHETRSVKVFIGVDWSCAKTTTDHMCLWWRPFVHVEVIKMRLLELGRVHLDALETCQT